MKKELIIPTKRKKQIVADISFDENKLLVVTFLLFQFKNTGI